VSRSEAVLFEEVIQGHARDAHTPGTFDEVEQVVATGVGVSVQELGDGSGEAGQELAMGSSAEAMMGGLDNLLGGETLLRRGGGAAESQQASDGRDGQAGVAVQQEMAEQPPGVVVVAAALPELESPE